MKKMRKILAVVLVLALALSLSACGAFESKMARAASKMQKLDSFRMDLNVDLSLAVAVEENSTDLDMSLAGTADVIRDPMQMKMDMAVKAMGEEQGILFYMEEKDDGYDTYASTDGGLTWDKGSIEADEDDASSASKPSADELALLLKCAETFEETGKEIIRGSEATVFSGEIRGEDIGEAMKLANAKEALEDLDVDLDDVDFSRFGSIPTTIAIDEKSGMISRVTMDMTEMMQQLMNVILEKVLDEMAKEMGKESGMEDMALSALGIALEIRSVNVTVNLYDYDQVKTIELPEAALAA